MVGFGRLRSDLVGKGRIWSEKVGKGRIFRSEKVGKGRKRSAPGAGGGLHWWELLLSYLVILECC